jgi:ABC-type methionine transport system ATPase subunit
LSGGQKQRIAIARAILTKPKLLILDEATSALDNKSEVEVQKALDIVSQGVTTVIIAHKIDTIKNSDNIICLDNGKVVEQGTHEDLLARGLYYSNLVQSQAEKERKEKQKQEERIKEELSRLSLSQHVDHNDINLEEIKENDEEHENNSEEDTIRFENPIISNYLLLRSD